MSVVIETTKGDITVDLYTKERPKTCLNFLKLCKQKLYNNNLFHMVQNNFIAQTGDPTETGRGGDSIFFHLYGDQARYFEAESLPRIKHTKQGQLSMVNCGDNMLGSQFFLTLAEDLDYLDGEHCVFGEVVEGFDIVEVLNETICDGEHRPYQDVRITHMVVLHDPFDDPPGLEERPDSPEPSKELIQSSRIGADEDINDYAGKTEEEINEIVQTKEAKARATILEMVGDLPDADCAPPENVLFVCKLNPVTNDDDLEIIFSRFGKVKCCEVIRDKKSGESLQYAFVEFEEESACESAYFKMDNVLIDDRRIHVDFSQSVAKFQWKGKGRLEVKEEKGEKKPQNIKPKRDDNFDRSGKVGKSGSREERGDLRDSRDKRDLKDDRDRNIREKRDEDDRDRNIREKRDEKQRSYERRDDRYRRDQQDKDRINSRNGDEKYKKNEKEYRDERNDQKYTRENRHEQESRDKRENRDRNRDERDYRNKDNRDRRDVKDSRDARDRDIKDRRDEKDSKSKYDRKERYSESRDRRDRENERYSDSRDRRDRENGERKAEARYAGGDRDRKEYDRDRYVKNSEKRKQYDERSERKESSRRKDNESDASSSESDDNRRHKDKKRNSNDSDRRKQKKKKYSDSSDSSSSDSD